MIPGAIYVEPYTWDTGVGVGANFGLDYRVAPRLSAGLVAQLSSTTLTEVDVGANLGLGALAEVLYPVTPRSSLVGQLGFITQPSGGNASAEVTWGPLFFLGVGVAYRP